MTISHFRNRLVNALVKEEIPENILTESDFEKLFVAPIAYKMAKFDKDIYLFSHPWNSGVACEPNCESALKGNGERRAGCWKCWKASKQWASIYAFGSQHNFDLVARDSKGGTLAVEIKLLKDSRGRLRSGEIQRFIGQCALAAAKFDHTIGICGYLGSIDSDFDRDTEEIKKWANKKGMEIIFRDILE